MTRFSEAEWIDWMDQLSQVEYMVVDDFISEELFRTITDYFDRLMQKDRFSKAGFGEAGNRQVEASVRGDFIYWLDRERDHELTDFFNLVDELTDNIRRYCYLSISDFEFHLAHYPAGTRYEKHVDQFHARTNRVLSVLVYLNENWKPEDAGELKMYRPDLDILIEPLARRLVVFRSDTVEHEVLKTNSSRKSLTGWLLRQPASVGQFLG